MNILVTDGAGHFGPTTSGPATRVRRPAAGSARSPSRRKRGTGPIVAARPSGFQGPSANI